LEIFQNFFIIVQRGSFVQEMTAELTLIGYQNWTILAGKLIGYQRPYCPSGKHDETDVSNHHQGFKMRLWGILERF